VAEGYDFDGIYVVVFLAVAFAVADNELAPFTRGDHCFDYGFSGKIHGVSLMG
jgi:hypothetical protein